MRLAEPDTGLPTWHAAALAANDALNQGHVATLSQLRNLESSAAAWPAAASMLILRNFTIEPLDSYVKVAAFRRGVELTVDVAGYDTADLDVRDPSSELRTGHHDAVVIALWLDELRQVYDDGGRIDFQAAVKYVTQLVADVLAVTTGVIVINTLLVPRGVVEPWDLDGFAELNRQIHALAHAESRVFVCDVHRRALELGLEQAIDARFWLSARAPVRPALHRLWALDLAQVVASVAGRSKKVLAIDCDNTLWGGIVGEDGLEGIALSPNDAKGRLYYTIQSQVVGLQRQGVLITLCSRNNEEDVWAVLEEHPYCLLKKEMLAGWRINWGDKASNLQELADQMNLGLDSFVFLDDSGVECERVRRALPHVDVLELDRDPAAALAALGKYDGWSRLRVTADDLKRTARYQVEQTRTKLQRSAESLRDFIASLELAAEMDIVAEAAPDDVIGRVAQLTQRTNQFNATTRRYGPGEIAALAQDPDAVVLRLQVRDRFGDYGTVGVAILVHENRVVRLDTFLLSCRVLGRGIEDAFLDSVVRCGMRRWPSADEVRVEYRQTPKNGVADRFLREANLRLVTTRTDPTGHVYAADRSWSPVPERQHVVVTITQQPHNRRASSTT